jgi:protease-4
MRKIMEGKKEDCGILFSGVRAFFTGFFGVGGLVFGLFFSIIIIGIFIGVLGSGAKPRLELDDTPQFQVKVLPNPQGERKLLDNKAPIILRLDIEGVIGTEALNKDIFRQQLMESREGVFAGNRVKAIVLQIDTPGGTVDDSDAIYLALKGYKERYDVPIYAFIDGLCASGGMYTAAAADKVMASDVSLIGSVGVIMPTFFNFSKVLDKWEIGSKTIMAGKGKDSMNPVRPWTDSDSKSFEEIIDYYYQQFLDIVTSNRKTLDRDLLLNEYGAQIFPAEFALEKGFIDGAGYTFDMLIEEIAEELKLEEGEYQVVNLEDANWFKGLFKGKLSMLTGQVTHHVELPNAIPTELLNRYLYLYHPNP